MTLVLNDPRLGCKFHPDRPATHIAPQHTGGDVDIPATWVPICAEHVSSWFFDDGDESVTNLQMFTLSNNLHTNEKDD